MLTDYYLPTLGGAQTSIKAQKEALQVLGHQVTVLCPLTEPNDNPDIIGLPTHPFIKPGGYPLPWSPRRVYKATLSALQEIKPDIIHVHSEMFVAFAGIRAAHTLKIPLVQTMHGRLDVYMSKVLPVPTITTSIYERLHHRTMSHQGVHIKPGQPYTRTRAARNMWRSMVVQANTADQVIVPSAHFAHKLQEQGVYKPLTIISNGIEPSITQALTHAEARQYDGTEPLRIMWCGRVSPEKRPLVFLGALTQLKAPLQVNMYGDGMALNQVKEFIAHHQLEEKVTVHGGVPQSEVLTAMQENHVFVSSSHDFDNQPMVMLEAIATGLPIIYCDPDLAEVVPPAGALCTPNPHEQGLAHTLNRLASAPEMVQKLSQATLDERQRAQQTNFTDKLLAVYTAALENHTRP